MLKKIILPVFFTLFLLPAASAAELSRFYTHGSPDIKKVALTFDDGPGRNTQIILDILEEKNVRATFFMTGSNAKARPALARRVRDGGHEIANHTFNHINFSSYTGEDKDQTFETELLNGQEAIFNATGIRTRLLRSPFGYSRSTARQVAARHGYIMVNWSFGIDWNRNLTKEEMHQRYKAHIKPGAIFLMHDLSSNPRVPGFLAQLIDDIRAAGLEPVTLSELLGLE